MKFEIKTELQRERERTQGMSCNQYENKSFQAFWSNAALVMVSLIRIVAENEH